MFYLIRYQNVFWTQQNRTKLHFKTHIIKHMRCWWIKANIYIYVCTVSYSEQNRRKLILLPADTGIDNALTDHKSHQWHFFFFFFRLALPFFCFFFTHILFDKVYTELTCQVSKLDHVQNLYFWQTNYFFFSREMSSHYSLYTCTITSLLHITPLLSSKAKLSYSHNHVVNKNKCRNHVE